MAVCFADIVTVLRSHGPGCPEVAAAGCRSVYCLTVIDSNSNNDDLGTAGACEGSANTAAFIISLLS